MRHYLDSEGRALVRSWAKLLLVAALVWALGAVGAISGTDRAGASASLSPWYMLAGSDGGVFAFGRAVFSGSNAGGLSRGTAVAVLQPTYAGAGNYLLVDSAGVVHAHGSARSYGDLSRSHLSAPIVAATWTSSGGYFLVSSAGTVYSFHTTNFGSLTQTPPSPIVGIAMDASGKGYWLVDRGGRVFAFGDAPRLGDLVDVHLSAPIVSIADDPTEVGGNGYLLAAADGGVFAFGGAKYLGSAAHLHLVAPIVAIISPFPGSYYLAGGDGGVFAFGKARYEGGLAGKRLNGPITSMAIQWVTNPCIGTGC